MPRDVLEYGLLDGVENKRVEHYFRGRKRFEPLTNHNYFNSCEK